MTMLTREQTVAAIAKAKTDCDEKCEKNRVALMVPATNEVNRLNKLVRGVRNTQVKKLTAYLAVIDSGVTPCEDEVDAV